MLHFEDFGLSPTALSIGPFALRWYALSYLAMLLLGWMYMRRLVRHGDAPLSVEQVDDLLSYVGLASFWADGWGMPCSTIAPC